MQPERRQFKPIRNYTKHGNANSCVTNIMPLLTCGVGVVQAIASSYNDITVAHLCYIAHVPHVVTGLYDALLLKLSVKD